MLSPSGGRVSEAIRSKPYGIRREFTDKTLMLYGRVLTSLRTVAFDGENGAGDRIETVPVAASRVMFTEPKLLEARPVVWRSVVMIFPFGGIWRRSGSDRYSRRTW